MANKKQKSLTEVEKELVLKIYKKEIDLV